MGLDIILWQGNKLFEYRSEGYKELIPPIALNVHFVSPEHRHEDHVYFATTETMEIVEPEGREKSGGCFWLTKEELVTHADLEARVKEYALKALEILAP